jgi:hypothetical protein
MPHRAFGDADGAGRGEVHLGARLVGPPPERRVGSREVSHDLAQHRVVEEAVDHEWREGSALRNGA